MKFHEMKKIKKIKNEKDEIKNKAIYFDLLTYTITHLK